MVDYQRNLFRTIELINLCFTLKSAYLRTQHPEASERDIRRMINAGIVRRKEAQWKLGGRPQDLLDIQLLRDAQRDANSIG